MPLPMLEPAGRIMVLSLSGGAKPPTFCCPNVPGCGCCHPWLPEAGDWAGCETPAPQLSAGAGLLQAGPGVAAPPKDGVPCCRGDELLAPPWFHDCCGWFQPSGVAEDGACPPQGGADC